jgi:hypothetical protein
MPNIKQASLSRTLLAGLAGGMAMNIAMLLTFRLLGFGWSGGGILNDPKWQSPKLIAVWNTLEPLPLVIANPAPIVMGLVLFGIAHAFLYRWLSVGWPIGIIARGRRMTLLIFVMTFLFWEFFTPFNQFGEPIPLIALELVFWAVIAAAEGFSMAAVFEWRLGPLERK